MPNVDLTYYAMLRDEAGCMHETYCTQVATLAQLYDELAQHHGFSPPRRNVRVAVDGAFSSWDQPVNEGSSVVFIPPVSGG